jgi:methylthioribulose-1-phosphate dehydratase
MTKLQMVTDEHVSLKMPLLDVANRLAAVSRECHARGWAPGTSGNFSAVSSQQPFRLAVTASGVDKGALSPDQVLEIDAGGSVVAGTGRPSAEASLHLTVVRVHGAGAVLHTHSLWSTILSEAGDGLAIQGYEMLKALQGVTTHDHSEWVPIIENTQDWPGAVPGVEAMLARHPESHGFLIRRHGLYTWGRDLAEAKRHVEALEFLFEVMGRKET